MRPVFLQFLPAGIAETPSGDAVIFHEEALQRPSVNTGFILQRRHGAVRRRQREGFNGPREDILVLRLHAPENIEGALQHIGLADAGEALDAHHPIRG